MKKIFILNGAAHSGKDSFVDFVSKFVPSIHYSYVANTKEAAKEYFDWDGNKSEKDRKFLADLNTLAEQYNDKPFKDVVELAKDFVNDKQMSIFNHHFMFIDAREIGAINRLKDELHAESIYMYRDGVETITSNQADAHANDDYDYDYYVYNNGSPNDLKDIAKSFVDYIIEGNKKLAGGKFNHAD